MLNPSLRRVFRTIVGDEWYMEDKEDLIPYSHDATPLFYGMPDAVLMPGSTQEVQQIVKLAAKHHINMITRGSGTNLCGGTVPIEGGIVIVMTRMNRILEIDQDNLTVTFQPGVITGHLHQAVEALGLFYPPDPSSLRISTLGGNISECAGGLRGLKYGVTKDYIIGLEVVLPNGEILRSGGKSAKDVAGYDLTKLFVGAEGTLGIVTEATAKLIPLPETKRTMMALFHSLSDASRATSQVISSKIIPATMEFMDRSTIRVVEDFAKVGLPIDAEAVLLIEQDGPLEVVERDMAQIADICEREKAFQVYVANTLEEGQRLLTARRSALAALSRLRPTTILEDATVPRSQIANMVDRINEIAAKYNVNICTFGHAGDGNLHPTCMTDERDKEEIHRVEQAFNEIFKAALELGGTITGEHGVGMAKKGYLELKVGSAGIEAMKGIKQAFDPHNLMNPGKIFAKNERKRVVVRNG
jgi:glycolate oxidase